MWLRLRAALLLVSIAVPVAAGSACGRIGYDAPSDGAVDGAVADVEGGPVDASLTDGAQGGDGGSGPVVQRIYAGFGSSCAVTDTGLLCWGDGQAGKLGDPIAAAISSPRLVPVGDVREVGIGESTSCLLRGVMPFVMCAGDGSSGQLGDATIVARSTFGPTIPTSAMSLTAGWRHVVAFVSPTELAVWGNNTYGQLGDGARASRNVPFFVTVPEAVSVSAGGFHSCARGATTGISCWGRNDEGQAGAPGGADVLTPTWVPPTMSTRYVDVTGGEFSTCAVRVDGAVECWGSNLHGQLGDSGVGASSTVPVVVPGLAASRVLCGYYHCCAIELGSGEVVCFGANASGQLGRGTTSMSEPPGPVSAVGTVRELAVGAFHTCAIDSVGEVACWGANESGQLGNGTLEQSSTPVPVVWN